MNFQIPTISKICISRNAKVKAVSSLKVKADQCSKALIKKARCVVGKRHYFHANWSEVRRQIYSILRSSLGHNTAYFSVLNFSSIPYSQFQSFYTKPNQNPLMYEEYMISRTAKENTACRKLCMMEYLQN